MSKAGVEAVDDCFVADEFVVDDEEEGVLEDRVELLPVELEPLLDRSSRRES
ncbi:MAG TPA: hypothetical protein VHU84_18760 [Lacipirellulaceae bacterium]|jgi:hypothetical protein|nr:hypothetical protein [Lacipirellulaceae bacterium]